ncbi:MAG: FimB/Mfa2 family fimbrial subunit [Prevotella sp.]|nr:FimB/Mfa2 family fimbrial subunit [Prevotella sp.]
MKSRLIKFPILLLLLSAALMTVSCSKDVYSDDEVNQNGNAVADVPTAANADCTLQVRTRAEATEESKISYPVYVYVLSAAGVCVEEAVIGSSETQIEMKLPAGTYDVCAVGGAVDSDYDIPLKENAAAESVIRLKEGRSHGDLMYAHSAVTLASKENNTLTLPLKRRVMLLQEVVIDNVPMDVTAVTVTIAPIYEGLRIDGNYSGAGGSHTVTLAKEGADGVWRNTSETYLLEAVTGATVKVQLTDAEGTKSYSYSLADELQANYKIRIKGTYVSQSGVSLTGIISGDVWAGERVITFDMSDENEGNNPSVGGDTPIVGDAPAAGTMYNGCYVLSKESLSDGSVKVVLMSARHTYGLVFTQDDENSVETAVASALKEFATDGISGWRLPSYEEIIKVNDNYSKINAVLKTADGSNTITPGLSYFYRKSDGGISAYCATGGADFNKSTRLRAFSTVIFK